MMIPPATIQFAYAVDQNGKLTHIHQAKRSSQYTCPGCGKPLTPVLGQLKAKHYRHSTDNCAYETYLHHCAKKAFLHSYQSALAAGTPVTLELRRELRCQGPRLAMLNNPNAQCSTEVAAKYNLTQFFSQALLERRDKETGLQPDVLLYDESTGRRCYVEIHVTHPCSEDKIRAGIPILEFTVATDDDIQMLLGNHYTIAEEHLSVFNWKPPAREEQQCGSHCVHTNTHMRVWRLSQSGRLLHEVCPLTEIDTTSNTPLNVWPSQVTPDEEAANLRKFLSVADPRGQHPNCVRCQHTLGWRSGFVTCVAKRKLVPYTEAMQCAQYKEET